MSMLVISADDMLARLTLQWNDTSINEYNERCTY